jgi:hypothetical protein
MAGRVRAIEKSNDHIGNRTRDLPACFIVPRPTTLPCVYLFSLTPDTCLTNLNLLGLIVLITGYFTSQIIELLIKQFSLASREVHYFPQYTLSRSKCTYCPCSEGHSFTPIHTPLPCLYKRVYLSTVSIRSPVVPLNLTYMHCFQ